MIRTQRLPTWRYVLEMQYSEYEMHICGTKLTPSLNHAYDKA